MPKKKYFHHNCVTWAINGETNNHTIREKEPAKDKSIFGMDNSAVI